MRCSLDRQDTSFVTAVNLAVQQPFRRRRVQSHERRRRRRAKHIGGGRGSKLEIQGALFESSERVWQSNKELQSSSIYCPLDKPLS